MGYPGHRPGGKAFSVTRPRVASVRAVSRSGPRRGRLAAVSARRATLLAASLFAAIGCSPTLPPASPHAFVAPKLAGTPIDVCWVEYATGDMPGSYGLAGSSDALTWDITFSGLLVRHPQGDLLIDVGTSTHFKDELGTSGFVAGLKQRFLQGSGDVVAPAADALRRVGEDPRRLRAIALTHVHGDHAGGIMDLAGPPIVLSPRELAFVQRAKDDGGFHVIRAHALAIERRAKPIAFTSGPYETFDESADFYGDGSVVFVPLYGHTPGSIGVFVSRSPSQRWFHVGDAANTVEAIEKRRGKSVFLEVTDEEGAEADRVVARLTQLHAADPAVALLPAHDRKAWRRAFGAPYSCVSAAAR